MTSIKPHLAEIIPKQLPHGAPNLFIIKNLNEAECLKAY